MTDTKISALAELAEAPAILDELALVDKSDTAMAVSGTTKRIKASNLLAAMPVVNAAVPPYSADRTGATDARPAIQTAIDDANTAGGGVVFLPWGTYKISSTPGLQLKDKVSLRGAGMAATVLSVGVDLTGSNEAVIGTTGASLPTSLSTNVVADLTVDASAGATTLTLDTTASLVDEGYYMLGSDDRAHAGTTVRQGELVRIESIDSGTAVTLRGNVRANYTVATGDAKLYSLTFISGLSISDLRIHNALGFDTTTTSFIILRGVRDFAVERVLMTDGDSVGIQTQFCSEGKIDIVARNFNDNTGSSRSGYPVHIQGLNENIRVNVNIRRARHGVTSGSISSVAGMSRAITVSGIVSEATTAAFDTHGSGEGWVYNDAHAINCVNAGFHVRGLNTRIQACTTNYCDTAVTLNGAGTLGKADNTNIIGCVFRKTTNRGGSDGHAIQVDDGATRTRVQSTVIDGTSRNGINVDGDDVEILNTSIVDPGQSGSAARCIAVGSTGSNVYVDNCTLVRHASGSVDVLSSGTAATEAIQLNASATGCVIRRNNRVYGITTLCIDGGSNTVEQLASAYTISNVTTDRTYNANSYTMDELADVLGTLIADLKTLNILP